MKRILYTDCNNNASFMKWLFCRVNEFIPGNLLWNIQNIDFSVVYNGDFFEGVPPKEMEKIYKFQKESSIRHIVNIRHNEFVDLFDYIQTIYEGEFVVSLNPEQIRIKVFDGDIIEIDGCFEEQILNSYDRIEEYTVIC